MPKKQVQILRPLPYEKGKRNIHVPRGCKVFLFEITDKIRFINKDQVENLKLKMKIMKNPKLLFEDGKAFAAEGKKRVEITSNLKILGDGKTAHLKVDINGDPGIITLHEGQDIEINEETGVLTQFTIK